MSAPAETSSTWDRSALGLSRVTIMGGLGLFLEPGGRPRGRREEGVAPPELVAALGVSVSVVLWSLSGESSVELSADGWVVVGRDRVCKCNSGLKSWWT